MPLTPTAYYNAGSAALVLVLIALVVGGFLWWRSKRRAARGLALATHEEHIPLNSALADEDRASVDGFRPRKGKERASELPEEEAIFEVGDDEDARTPLTAGHRS